MASNWEDEDAPPPLSTLADQVSALQIQGEGSARSEEASEANLRPAAVSVIADCSKQPAKSKTSIKKGFFDAKPAKTKQAGQLQGKQPGSKSDAIPTVKASKGTFTSSSGKAVPEFLRIEPDEQEKKYAEMKGKLIDALKPTTDTITQIQSDPGLLAGFDDPEIQAAVNDVASNASNIKKYQNNKKVMDFYRRMAGFTSKRLESMGDNKTLKTAATK